MHPHDTTPSADSFPDVSDLPAHSDLPDALRMFDGMAVDTPQQWHERRAPELRRLFQHYMYGSIPPAPARLQAVIDRVNPHFLDGIATLKELSLHLGPQGDPIIRLMLIVPNHRPAGAPVFLGINVRGNHTVVDEPDVALRRPRWTPPPSPDAPAPRPRGADVRQWVVPQLIERGYALATFNGSDVAPDSAEYSPVALPAGQGQVVETMMLSAWAWSLHRAVDYLVTDPDIDAGRIAVVGHSRRGKAALLAGAFDPRIALVIPHQSGCGGAAPSRCHNPQAETLAVINRAFPHWFNATFKQFVGHEDRLPFDQHCLIALVAPRPLLLTCGQEDQWANPPGQFDMLQAADKVYRLLGVDALAQQQMPPIDGLIDSRLGYHLRAGGHSMNEGYWSVFLDYADKWMKPARNNS